MLSVLYFSFNAIAPIIGLVIVGYAARTMGFLDPQTLKTLNRFNFRFCFTPMMFVNLYQMNETSGVSAGLVLTILVTLLLLTAISLPLSGKITSRRDRRGILMQCMFRSNYAIIGLVLAETLAGNEGKALASFCQLPTVLYFNVVSVLCLSAFSGSGEKPNPGKVVRELFTNPLIMGVLTGSAALLLRGVIPVRADGAPVFALSRDLPWLYQIISYLSRIATPLALIVMGGQLDLSREAIFQRELLAGVALKLLVAPAIGLTLAFLSAGLGFFSMTPAVVATLCAAYGTPAAAASAPMAAEMGADGQYAGQIVVWTSIFSMGTLFLIVALLRALGQV